MRLSKKALEDFKSIYYKKFSIRLTDVEAQEKGSRLLELVKLIYKPIPEEDSQQP